MEQTEVRTGHPRFRGLSVRRITFIGKDLPRLTSTDVGIERRKKDSTAEKKKEKREESLGPGSYFVMSKHQKVMKQRFVLMCMLAWICQCAMAQISISGFLADSLGNAIKQETNVTLLTKTDMLKAAQATVKDGHFKLQFTPKEDTEYLLYVFALGYKDRYLDIPKKGGDMGRITLEPLSLTLSEVIIRPGRLQHDIVNGNDVFQIGGTTLAREHSINTMLSRLPGIAVMNDQVTVIGSGSPTFTINGKVPRPGEMDLITPNLIDKVTINTMPSAKYSASVNSVIDLKLKKTLKDYLSINLLNNIIFSSAMFREKPSANINISAGKLSTYIGYGYGYNHSTLTEGSSLERTQLPDGTEYIQKEKLHPNETGLDWTHTLNISPKYQFNDKSSLDIQYAFMQSKARANIRSDISRQTWNNGTETAQEDLILNKWAQTFQYRHSIAARYIYEIAPEKNLVVNMGYSRNKDTNNENNSEISNDETELFLSDQKSYSKTFTTTVDYSTKLWEKLTVEFGGKYTYLTSDNRTFYENELNENSLVEAKEQTAVGYLNISQLIGKFYYSLGLRAEYQNRHNEYFSLDRIDKENSFNLIPKVGLNYRPSKALSMNLSYNYLRYNPSPVDLDPTSYFINKYMYRMGNPELKPTETHNFQFRISHLPINLTFIAAYRYNRNGICSVYQTDDENPQIIKSIKQNHDFSKLSLTLSYYGRWGKYSLGASASYLQEFSTAEYMGKNINYSHPYTSLYLRNYYTLPKGFSVECGITYTSKCVSFPVTSTYKISGDAAIRYNYKDLSIRLIGCLVKWPETIHKYGYYYKFQIGRAHV